jgi:hypothetical protein
MGTVLNGHGVAGASAPFADADGPKQHFGEQIVTLIPEHGFSRLKWHKLHARAAAWFAGAYSWTDATWQDLENQIAAPEPAPAKQLQEHVTELVIGPPPRPSGAIRSSIYFNAVWTLVNVVLSFEPSPWTAAMIATEIPAAIRPYSIAVAADSSFANLISSFMTQTPSTR